MKKAVLLLFVIISLQACGLALLDPNARTNISPATPGGPEGPGGEGDAYTIGGTVVGLPLGYDLDGDVNNLPYTFEQDGTFIFPYNFDDGVEYEVSVGTLPGGYSCTIDNATGSIDGENVTDVLITCDCQPDGDIAGDGSVGSPIEVWDAMQLDSVATTDDPAVVTYYYKQMCDIDYTGIDPTPIGTSQNKFTGSYDGQGFFITNYTSDINDPAANNQRKGIFGHTSGAIIENVHLQNISVTANAAMDDGNANSGSMGALVGIAANTKIENVYANNIDVDTNGAPVECVGGLVGIFEGIATNGAEKNAGIRHIHLKDVQVDANLSLYVGGLIGGSVSKHGLNEYIVGDSVHVNSCYAHCGGLIGTYDTDGPDFDANLLGFRYVQFENSSVTGNGKVGGLGGSYNSHMDRAIFEGTVQVTELTSTSSKTAGGAFGKIYPNNDVNNSFVIADILSGPSFDDIGPFYGRNQGTGANFTSNSYLTGQTCQNCVANPEIDGQANVNALYDATDAAMTNPPFVWDFVGTWCTRPDNVPTLFDVPFSNCD